MSPAAAAAAGPTRWCPTPEQLMILEEMYNRGGVRTPNAAQIQQITALLSLYGRIEGKNVFYWFQNHKARDRQKLRRRLLLSAAAASSNTADTSLRPPQQHRHPQSYHQPPPPSASPHHPFLRRCMETCPPSAAPFTCFLPQNQGTADDYYAPTQVMDYTRKIQTQQGCSETPERSMMRLRDWTAMMMLDVGPTSVGGSNPNRPLKTLQLFPITTTNLKEESTTTTT